MLKLVPGFRFYHLINSVSVSYLPRQNLLFAQPSNSALFPLLFALKAKQLLKPQHPLFKLFCNCVLFIFLLKMYNWVMDSMAFCGTYWALSNLSFMIHIHD